MRLSWNEIRARAATFSRDWSEARYERGDTQTFYNEFFELFGVKRRKVATFEEPVKKLGVKQGFIDLFWKGKLLVEQKSSGRDLVRARQQALDYFPGLKDHELPRYILVCDFQSFHLTDLDTREEVRFALADLPAHVEAFGFIVGIERRVFKDQDPVNILAAEIMGKLHDALKSSGYDGAPLERLLVRILFCLFADDTGIFDELGQLQTYIEDRTAEDGSDLGSKLSELFQVLNTPPERRQRSLDEDLGRFPYINGDLFAVPLPIPAFNKAMRDRLLEACGFSWEKISPAIFGALFQSVMNAKERRAKGAHYTTEKNILKVIEPLFLDDLRAELNRILALKRGRDAALRTFQDKLASLNLFDPACGCGNFLIIAYRELRLLELDVITALYPEGQRVLDATALSKVDVDQFYGIEIDEFPARIAETAMWMMDHIMNNRLSQAFGQVFARIPLKAAPHIVCDDALDIDWATVLAPERCSYVLGNPPFIGFVMRGKNQQTQAGPLMTRLGASGSRLDFVAAWFLKAGEYVQRSNARIAFVATNSITQGEQVAQLWPALFNRWGLEIIFAHRPFEWGSDARGKAHLHVVVLGLVRRGHEPSEKRLFSYTRYDAEPTESTHPAISPYLFDASLLNDRHLVVLRNRHTPSGMPPAKVGTKPVDGGYLILNDEERDALISSSPSADQAVRPFYGTEEFLGGKPRWLIVLSGIPNQAVRSMNALKIILENVRRYRKGEIPPKRKPTAELKTPSALSLSLSNRPSEFHVTLLPTSPFMVIPEVSSEERDYIPIGWLNPPSVPSNKLIVFDDAKLWAFGLVTSRMHLAWTKFVGGRLESRYQYSTGINYNAFPWPAVNDVDKARLDSLAQAVLDARSAHPGESLADLYDPDVMPADLRKAHRALDLAVDRLYRKLPFDSDRERVEHLFMLYEQMTAGLLSKPTKTKRSKRTAVA